MKTTRTFAGLLSSVALLFGFGSAAAGGPVGPVDTDLRLLVGFAVGDTAQLGLEIALQPGWKTYWRSPGDAGIPPSIDTTASENVAGVEVDFPAPVRFGDGYGEGVGYVAPVVLPMRVRLVDPSKPAKVVAKVLVGVCREICVPLDAVLEATVRAGATPMPRAVAAIAAAKARVPRPIEPGANHAVVAVDRQADALVFTVRDPASPEPRDLFVEGPPGWALPLAARIASQGGTSTWRVALEGLPEGARPDGARLRLTLTSGPHAAEQTWTLD